LLQRLKIIYFSGECNGNHNIINTMKIGVSDLTTDIKWRSAIGLDSEYGRDGIMRPEKI
jgi:hypothetical protein